MGAAIFAQGDLSTDLRSLPTSYYIFKVLFTKIMYNSTHFLTYRSNTETDSGAAAGEKFFGFNYLPHRLAATNSGRYSNDLK